jgi:two-component system, OmpR family, response regulator VicR
VYNTPVAPGSPRVLVVDDEPSICSALAQVLKRAGFDPVLALGAAEADGLLSESISAMLLDLRMAHMRGDVFFYLAAARFPILGRRTLFITGDISRDAERLIAHTGCRCLWKPFQNFELVDAVRSMLADQAGPPVGAI